MLQEAGPFAAGQVDRPARRTTTPAPINAPRPFWSLVEDRTENRRLADRVAREETLVQGALWDRHRQVEALIGRPVPPSAMMTGQGADGVGTLTDAEYEARLDAMRQEFAEQMAPVESRADLAARLSGEPTVTYYETPSGPASVRTQADGSLWLETREGRSGPLSSFPGARPVRRARPDDVSRSDGTAASPRVRSLGERLSSTAEDIAHTNPIMGAGRWLISRGPAFDEFEDPANPGETIRFASLGSQAVDYERERRDSYRMMAEGDAWNSGDASWLHKGARGAATLLGALAGSAADPTALIAPGRTVAGRVIGASGINALLDVGSQSADVATGIEDEYRPLQTVIAAGLGAVVQGGAEGVAPLARALSGNPGGVVEALASEIDAGSRQIAGTPLPPAMRAAASRAEQDATDSARIGPADGATRQRATRAMDAGGAPPTPAPERGLDEIFDTSVSARPDGLSTADYQGRRILSGSFDPMVVDVDPARFQFRQGGDDEGLTGALADVTEWDQAAAGQAIMFEDRAGRVFAVDGHQRRGLARRMIESGQAEEARLDGRLFREADGWAADDVRTVAAITNLRQESGTVLDAATLLRQTPHLIDDRSLPVAGLFVDVARDLARLSDEAFGAVAAGAIPQRLGAVVGELASDQPDLHAQLVDLIRQAQPRSLDEGRALVFEGRRADDSDLDGGTPRSPAEQIERARLRAAVLQQLRLDRPLYERIVRDADAVEAFGHAFVRTPQEASVAADMVAFSAMDRLATGRDGADAFAAALARKGPPDEGARAIVAELRDAVRVMDEVDADRLARIAPGRPSEGAVRAVEPFDKPGGPGQKAQAEPKPEDAETEAMAGTLWDDLPEVGEEERALSVLRQCAPGGS